MATSKSKTKKRNPKNREKNLEKARRVKRERAEARRKAERKERIERVKRLKSELPKLDDEYNKLFEKANGYTGKTVTEAEDKVWKRLNRLGDQIRGDQRLIEMEEARIDDS